MKNKLLVLLLVGICVCTNLFAQTSQPYSNWYGYNKSFDDYTPHSSVRVSAPISSDVIVIIRYGSKDGIVAGHYYISKGETASIDLDNGIYQVFFYYGSSWSYSKEMGNELKEDSRKTKSLQKTAL